MFNIDDILEFAQEAISERVRAIDKDAYTDDWKWGDTCFQFVVDAYHSNGTDCWTEHYGTFRFCYDAEDVFERDAITQLMDWINENF